MAVFEVEKSSTDIVKNGTMSDDEVVASDVRPRYLLPTSSVYFPVYFLDQDQQSVN